MMAAVRDFGNQLKNGGVGLFYFAGHGIQSKGNNYLVPVGANIRHEDELATRAYNANEVLEKMGTAKNRINMVVLDACRDNPFARSFRSSARGLAGIEQAPTGTLVAYATSPGATAADGAGSNGLYTEQLLRALGEPGMKMEDVFKRVRVSVMEKSDGKQVPWEMSSVVGDFYFNPTATQLSQMPALAATPSASAGAQLQRELLPVLIPRKLIGNYQLVASIGIQSPIAAALFTLDGHKLALAGKDKSLKIIDAQSGNTIAVEPGFGDATLSTDKRFLIGVNDNGTVTLADLHRDAARKVYSGMPQGLLTLGISPNGKQLVIYSRNNGFALFNLDTSQWVGVTETVEGAPMFAFSPSGDRLITWGSMETNLTLWDPEKGTPIKKMRAHWKTPTLVKFSRDGKLLLTVAQDDTAITWRTADGEDLYKFSFGDGSPIPIHVEFIKDEKKVLAYAVKSTKVPGGVPQLSIWNMATGTQVVSFLADSIYAKSIRLSRDLQRMFVIGGDRNTHVFDLDSVKRVNTLSGMELVAFSPDDRRLIAKSADGMRLMDMHTLAPLAKMPGQVQAFVPQRSGNPFATAAADGTLTLWSFENGDPVSAQLKGHHDAIAAASFSADGRRLVSIGGDQFARLWTIPDIKDAGQLIKDQFESSTEYHKRLANWHSPYTAVVDLANYDADTETYTVKLGDATIGIPLARDAARKLVGQRQALVKGVLKFFDAEQLVLTDFSLSKLP